MFEDNFHVPSLSLVSGSALLFINVYRIGICGLDHAPRGPLNSIYASNPVTFGTSRKKNKEGKKVNGRFRRFFVPIPRWPS